MRVITMRTMIEVLVGAILICWGIIGTTTANLQTKRVRAQNELIENQYRTIDSLISLPRETFQVDLNVSDNSKTTLNAKKQSGEIIFPNNKVYELRIDSLSIQKATKK